MNKRGYNDSWQNNRWRSIASNTDYINGGNGGWNGGIPTPNVPDPNYLYNWSTQRGQLFYRKTLTEVSYISPKLYNENVGEYCFYQTMRNNGNSITISFGVARTVSNKLYEGKNYIYEDEPVYDSEGDLIRRDVVWNSYWDNSYGDNNYSYKGYSLFQQTISNNVNELWSALTSLEKPLAYADTQAMVSGSKSTYYFIMGITTGVNSGYSKSLINTYTSAGGNVWSSPAIFWLTGGASDIVYRAKSLSSYKYWYGGSGQIATIQLANSLRSQWGSVWTREYYEEAILDINGVNRVGDCSFLVSYAYNISRYGSSQIANMFPTFSTDSTTAPAGMILWRAGHVAISDGNYAIQLSSLRTDYVEKPLAADLYTKVLYDPNINY